MVNKMKVYIVICKDYYGYEDFGYNVSEVRAFFDKEKAKAYGKKFSTGYACGYDVEEVDVED